MHESFPGNTCARTGPPDGGFLETAVELGKLLKSYAMQAPTDHAKTISTIEANIQELDERLTAALNHE
jgi:hypothetical protein